MRQILSITILISGFLLWACKAKAPEIDIDPPISTEIQPNLTSARSFLVDKNATIETAALFYNLKKNSEKKYLLGVHENPTIFMTAASVSEAIYGTDYMFITDIIKNPGTWYQNKQTEIRNNIKQFYKEGQVITLCWHFRNPIPGEADNFYWKSLLEANPSQQRIVPRIIPNGTNHDLLKKYLDVVADFANSLVDDNGKKIPVIFRPWHEQNGDWFWWGMPHHCTKEEYISLWRFTVEYLRDTKDIHHFLYCYSPNGNTSLEKTYLEDWGYPGDEYIDILGVDRYLSNVTSDVTNTKNQITLISDLAIAKKKVAAFTETGYDSSKNPQQPTIFDYYTTIMGNSQIAYMMFWSGAHYIPSNTYFNFSSYVRSSRVNTGGNMPNMFVFPTK